MMIRVAGRGWRRGFWSWPRRCGVGVGPWSENRLRSAATKPSWKFSMSIAATNDEPEPDGETLRDRLQACQQEGLSGIPAAELVCHVWDVASFLDALHAQGQTHRDVKPDTIRIVNGRALLADAEPLQTPSADVNFAGTPAYIAPEAWGGRLGPKSDQYSLACSYAELRLGRLPLSGADFVAMMRAHLSAKPDLAGL